MFIPADRLRTGDTIIHPGIYGTSGLPQDEAKWTVVVTGVEMPEEYDGEMIEITYREIAHSSEGHILTVYTDEQIELVNG